MNILTDLPFFLYQDYYNRPNNSNNQMLLFHKHQFEQLYCYI